ncbi:uncharacterized protein LOC132790175 isoform X1 [Drosophila nasuta]|uniref:uncharacterized protein LOC132790175 isoform X1 n=1 Tax=Drosophila nasuta TaxID=42062 RepID=UPI00295E5131|nr:uncharacterized protein LOC132790175 isoform X1 [Drosophila nasuta]
MPRRRRPRCKVKPLIALCQDQATAGDSDGSQDDQLNESKSDDLDTPTAVATHPHPYNTTSLLPDWEYKHFPELHNQLPCLPTFADVFGQHSEVIFQEHRPQSNATTDRQLRATLLPDFFGLAGLVANLRAPRGNVVNAVQLAIGEDLTTFGLDLTSQGDIYVHFNGPFTQQPASRSSANCALELGMRGMRDAMNKYPTRPPIWEPFVPETRDLGLLFPVPKFAQQSRKKSA